MLPPDTQQSLSIMFNMRYKKRHEQRANNDGSDMLPKRLKTKLAILVWEHE